MVGPNTSRSSYVTAPSALDPRRDTPLVIASFASEWYFKPEGVALVKKRFEVELAILEQTTPWDYQVENRWNAERAMWQVRCAKVDIDRVWKAFFTVMDDVIREAIRTANQRDGELGDTAPTLDVDEDDDEDYAFAHDEPLDSNLVQRLAVCKMQNSIRDPKAEVELADEGTEPELTPVTRDETYPPEIQFYKYRQAWKCGDNSIILDDLLPETDLRELVRLTGCQFSMDFDEGIMYVGAHEEENVLLAVHKLDNIERNLKYRHPWANHLFYSEDSANVKYFLRYFVDIRLSYFETTLLDNLQVTFSNGACDYEALSNAVTVRCAPKIHAKSDYIPIKKLNISEIMVEDIPGGVKVFSTSFTYNGKGNPLDNPMLHRPVHAAPSPPKQSNLQHLQSALAPQSRNSNQKDELVQRWAKDVPDAISSGVVTNLNGLQDALRKLPNGTGDFAGDQAVAQKPSWDKYEEYSPEKVANVVKNEFGWNKKTAIGLISRPLAENIRAVTIPRNRAPLINGGPRQSNSAMSRSSSMPQVTIGSDGLMEPLKPVVLHQQSLQPLQPPPQLQRGQPAVTQQAQRTHSGSASHAVTITPHLNSSNRRLFSETIARSTRVQSSLLDEDDPFAGSLSIGVLAPITRAPKIQNQHEEEQLIQESEARVFHQTMNQRAPRPNQNTSAGRPKHNPFAGRLERPISPPKSTVSALLPDPLPEFVEEVNQNFKELMTGLRGYRGKVVVQAEFGRIIINRLHQKHISIKDHLRFYDGPFLQHMLLHRTEYSPTVDFTSVLTAVSAEIQYMINMKSQGGQGGQDLWENDKVARWDTTYEFVFTDLQNPFYPVMIEIDAETFVAQIKARCRLGNLFVYGTKRHWDVKVAAIGYGDSRALEQKYGDLATEVQSSLYIPPNSHQPYLSWKLATLLQKQFVIQEVNVRRVYEYKSTDHKSLLKVSELQSLDINGGPAGEKPFWIFEATPGNPDLAPIDKLTQWYEASVSSVQLNTVLEQNESLDLGDETAWTLEDVANMGASKDLYTPALTMLKQMDGVGQHSKNGSDYRSRRQAAQAMQAQAAEPIVWW